MTGEPQQSPDAAREPSTPGSTLAFVLVTAALLSLNFGMVTLTGKIADPSSGPAIKPFHVIFALLGVLIVLRGRIVRPRVEVALYFGVTVFCGLAAYLVFAPRRALINMLITLYVALIGGSMGVLVGEQRILRALRIASLVLLIAVAVKGALHAQAFLIFLAHPNGHPVIPTFSIGGPNLEATWVSLAGFFFIGTALFLPYVMASVVIGAAYASRVGVLIAGMVLVAGWVRSRVASRGTARSRTRMRHAVTAVALTVVVVVPAVLARRFSGAVGYVEQRFENIGDEPGSLGRLRLWNGGIHVLAEHPFGVGQGNSVPELERVMGVAVPEDNLHNVYLQTLVETGFPGLFVLLVFATMTWWRLAATRFQDRLLLYVAGYLLFATIQFSGADMLLWFTYGLHTGASALKRGSSDA